MGNVIVTKIIKYLTKDVRIIGNDFFFLFIDL